MRAYLDYNIFASLEDEVISFAEIKRIDNSITDFPYSAAHIQEVSNITAPSDIKKIQFITKRLNTISTISNNSYLYHDLGSNQIKYLIEEPEEVFNTINQPSFGKPAMQMFMNLISAEQKEGIRLSLGVDPKELNNYSPDEVVDQLNKSLVHWQTQDSFLQMIDRAISYFPSGQFNGLHNKIGAIYELLDMFGYWKDKETATSNYARLWDANHAFYASSGEYFISDDKRNRQKAKVVYKIYGISTKVLSSKGQ